ncbi:MAG: DNA polymerase III subunit epsilon [Burkholderiales bacterium]|nr:DNA polymerase III subunit epsilon [Burkholderiales bacterium]
MRQVVLDTETTGLNARLGDRIIEIGCVEIVHRRLTGNRFHRYVNPERGIEDGALRVHGITSEFLADKPRFAEVAQDLLDYLRGAELLIHNAAFDLEFLNLELGRIGAEPIERHAAGVLDTLQHARELHPGRKNSLDALCERYAIDNARRTLHGALLDAELLAEVYLAMTRGQETLAIELERPPAPAVDAPGAPPERPPLIVLAASVDELAEHRRVLEGIARESNGRCVWLAGAAAAA